MSDNYEMEFPKWMDVRADDMSKNYDSLGRWHLSDLFFLQCGPSLSPYGIDVIPTNSYELLPPDFNSYHPDSKVELPMLFERQEKNMQGVQTNSNI
jgi:hypothetical protein